MVNIIYWFEDHNKTLGVNNNQDVSTMGFALELTAVNNITISHIEDTSFENQQLWNKKKSKIRGLEFEG